MSSTLFIAASTATEEINLAYAQIETLEKTNDFEDETVLLVDGTRSPFSVAPTEEDFEAFKSSMLTRLRTALSAAYTSFNSTYACLAYSTLSAVTLLALTEQAGPLSILVEFVAAADATTYKIYRSETNDINTAVMLVEQAAVTYTDTGVAAATTYYYWVVAKATGYTDSAAATLNITTA